MCRTAPSTNSQSMTSQQASVSMHDAGKPDRSPNAHTQGANCMQLLCILTRRSSPKRQLRQPREGRDSCRQLRKPVPARIERLECYLLHQTKQKVVALVAAEAEAHQRRAQCAHASWQPGHLQTGPITTQLACREHHALQPGEPLKLITNQRI